MEIVKRFIEMYLNVYSGAHRTPILNNFIFPISSLVKNASSEIVLIKLTVQLLLKLKILFCLPISLP